MAVKKCFVEKCDSCTSRKEDAGVTYHKFPKDSALRETWTEVTQINSSDIELPSYVCSRHFRKSDFQSVKDSKYVLKSDAVPSIFPWSSTLVLSGDKSDTTMEIESDSGKLNPEEAHPIFIEGPSEKEDLKPSEVKREPCLNYNKDSDGENIESIKKFIEEQEKEILKLEAEVKPSKTEFHTTSVKYDSQNATVAKQSEVQKEETAEQIVDSTEPVKPREDEDMEGKRGADKQETISVASSLVDIILTESEARLANKGEKAAKGAAKVNNSMALSVGSKVEAKDFGDFWHPAQIMEVDYDEMEVLVHYDHVVKKTDEWINVSSPRLRPYAGFSKPSSPTLEAPESNPLPPAKETAAVEDKNKKPEFKIGDRCLARWRDNKRFMATVKDDFGHGKYEVVFDDGFQWVCNVSRLSRMRESLDTWPPLDPGPSTSAPATPGSEALPPQPGPYHTHLFDPTRDYLGSKSERRERKRKLNIKEIFNIGQKKKKEDKPPQETKRQREKKLKVVDSKDEVLLTVKIEPTTELPDAVSAIIGTVKAEETREEIKHEITEAKVIEAEVIETEVTEPEVIEAEVIEAEVIEAKDEIMVVDPTDLDMDDAVKEEEVAVEEAKLEPPEPTPPSKAEPFDLKKEAALDRIKVSIAKLEMDIDNVNSPKHSADEQKPHEKSSPTTSDRDKKRSLSRVKKAKKLRLLQEKKVKKEVEKVKSELEAMKTQLEEMKKQVGMKTEALYKKPEAPVAGPADLLPGEWCCKWLNGQPVGPMSEVETSSDKAGLPRRSVQVEDQRLPAGWTKHMVRRSLGSSAGKWDVVLVSPDNRRLHTKTDMRHYLEQLKDESLSPFESVLMDFGVHRKLSRRLGWDSYTEGTAGSPALPSGTLSTTSPLVKKRKLSLKKKKTLKVKIPRKHSKKKRKLPYGLKYVTAASGVETPAEEICEAPVLEDGYVWVGSLKVQVIDTLLRCPADGCLKNFRNNTLLQMHIKHYHRELKKMMGAAPKVSDLASARTAPVAGKLKCEGEPRIPKLKINKKRLEEPKQEPKTPELHVDTGSTTPVRPEDSPRLRMALVHNKPVKRPRVLLPVKKNDDTPPQTLHEAYLEQERHEYTDAQPLQNLEVLDFESAISTHTVTKPPQIQEKRKRGEKKKKTFATFSKAKQTSEDEEWLGANSDFETQSSYPRSGTPDFRFDKSVDGTPNAPVSSESTEDQKEPNVYMYTETGERVKIVHMKREEIINCHCGMREEDGLMIQCELCLCWQHALCHNIQNECEVPEKYTCSICLNPRRGRRSQRFLHDQDRLYEGLLPGAKPCDSLKRSHELSGNLLRIEDALHALKVKYYVAIKKDHPKLYLWAKDWEGMGLNFSPEKLNADYVNLNVMINEINKENLPLKPLRPEEVHLSLSGMRTPTEDEQDGHRESHLGSHSLLSGLLPSPSTASMDLPISTSDLERLASTVQEAADNAQRSCAAVPQPEAPIENSTCRENLLRHIQRCQAMIDARLDSIEAQVAELESQDPLFEDDETAHFFPRTKQTIQMMLRDLDTMEELGVLT